MSELGPLPPPIGEKELGIAGKLLFAAAQDPKPPLSTDHGLLDGLYYPLRQVPLPSFQYEMLLWTSDKLNVFAGSGSLKFLDVQTPRLVDPIVKYKRADAFTVLAIAASENVAAVFTNEMSGPVWELIGVFELADLQTHIRENNDTLVDYDAIETSFAERQHRKNNNKENAAKNGDDGDDDDDDEYWNKYDKETSPPGDSPGVETDEEDYWNRLAEQPQTLETGDSTSREIREFALQALRDLIELYKDCGVTDPQLALQDILSIYSPKGRKPPPQSIPEIPHKHAERTLKLLKQDYSLLNEEILAFVEEFSHSN